MRLKHYPIFIFLIFLMIWNICFPVSTPHAQITLDGTTGPAGKLAGPHYLIDANIGKQAGANLFHSFGQFNISTGESAIFSGPDSVSNIISRVTGGSGSWIDGPLRSGIPGANLYFLNPWGVMFGPNASLDISGSFHLSTAAYMGLGENGRFDAISPENSLLTAEPPAAFGFLDQSPGDLEIRGSLVVPPDHEVSLTGGNVEIPGGIVSASGGQIRIFSAASPGEVNLPDFPDHGFSSFKELGDISLSDGAMLDVGGVSGGEITIIGGRFYLSGAESSVSAITGNSQGHGINIHTSESLVVSQEASIFTVSLGGKGGDISISSESFFLDNGLIFSESGILIPSDDGSNVDLIGGKGNGGDIYMNIGSAEISGGMISANTLGTGKAGNISISGELLNIRDGAKIVADNGNIYIDEAGNIIDGTMIGGKGDSGNIALNVNQLEMHSASVSSNTLGSGTGGNVSITARDFVSIAGSGTDDAEHPADFYHGVSTQARGTGNGGHITIETDTLNLFTDAMINSQTYAEGRGGDITLSVNRLNVHEGGTVTTSSRGSGRAGDIDIQAEDAVNLSGAGVKLGKSHIFTATHSSGRSGDVTLSTRTLTLGENGLMSAESLGKGDAGNIRLRISDTFRADNAAVKTSAEQADGGDIFLNTKKRIYMTDSALTTSVSDGQGNGGNITIDPEFVILNNTQITANAHGGAGGNISIISEHYIRSAGSIVNASSELGIDGSVYIASPDEDAASGITVLSDNFPDADQWMPTPCPARSPEKVSRLILKTRDGIPASPDDYLPSPPRISGGKLGKPELFVQGFKSYHNGDFIQAAQKWEQSLTLSDMETDPEGHTETLIHLTQAYQGLGHYERALSRMNTALPLAEKTGENLLSAMILSTLGDLHLCMGNMDQAERFLKKGAEAARLTGDDAVLAGVLNHFGNFHASEENYADAISSYQEAIEFLSSTQNKAELKSAVRLNLIRARFLSRNETVTDQDMRDALSQILEMPHSHAKARNLLTLSLLDSKIKEQKSGSRTASPLAFLSLPSPSSPLTPPPLSFAAATAEKLRCPRISSLIYGYLGARHETEGNYEEAVRLTRLAMFLAQASDSPELLYQWQWQLARLFKVQRDIRGAIRACKAAIASLDPVRPEFRTGYREKKNRFDEEIRPVYLELTELLLKQAGTFEETSDLCEKKLIQARDTLELLKKAELEDFFQDECVPINDLTGSDRAPDHTAIIYPMLLPEHPTLLLILPDCMKQVPIPTDSETLRKTAERFRMLLERDLGIPDEERDKRYLHYAKQLYDWLIRPIKNDLAARDIKTLMIAPDGILRTIPFSALHDGEHFLARTYPVVIIPGSTLTDTEPAQTEPGNALLCGLSESVQGFPALPGVKREIEKVRAVTGDAEVLLDRKFTTDNLQSVFRDRGCSLALMATHGVFRGSARETFLVTYDGRLYMNQLEELIRLGKYREKQVDILFLSACQTALGDERAALGLGGLAVRTGVRSAIATLWPVDDRATSEIVTRFCVNLKAGSSKAEALQNARKKLMDTPGYSHPAYWAPFLLIGSRL